MMLNGFKTYLGIAIAVLAGLGAALGVTPAELPQWVDALFVVVGGAVATFGRADKERRAPDPK
jgi:hypothetical protein